jgi:hypothetical protein
MKMAKKDDGDDFPQKVKQQLALRSCYICSNPDCRAMTVAASEKEIEKYVYVGKAAHITAARPGGSRYDDSLTPEERASADNGIFLCSGCADMIDKNYGLDFPTLKLRAWKTQHEKWTRINLNKSPFSMITEINGDYFIRGIGETTGLDIQSPTVVKPGTKVTVEGIGDTTGVRISPPKLSE